MKKHINGANDRVVLALIGAGGRGTNVIISMVKNNPGTEVKYICEVDDSRGGRAISELEKMQRYKPQRIRDMRNVFEDKDIDAVVICTPEHWHALASIWACQAGKDVYVEKNISLSIHESLKMVEAGRKYERIIQCGTQNRSAEYAFTAREYINKGKLGNIVTVKNYCLLPGAKPWFLKPDTEIPDELDWNMWLGPAELVPYNVSRHKAWYDWWAYSGGNALAGDASHVMDLARLVLGDPGHPGSVYCTGGRIIFDDEREIPDIQSINYDYGDFVMTCESGGFGHYMSKSDGSVRYGDLFPEWQLNSTRIEIYGTQGLMYLGRHGGGWQVLDEDGNLVAEEFGRFPDIPHQQNFIDCLRSRKDTNGDVFQGHMSASLVNQANLSYRSGEVQLYIDPKTGRIVNNRVAEGLDLGYYREGFKLPDQI